MIGIAAQGSLRKPDERYVKHVIFVAAVPGKKVNKEVVGHHYRNDPYKDPP